MEPQSNLLIYQSEDGVTRIETRLENETVWLTQAQMADLFQKERSVITKHISNVFADGELDEKSNVQILHISGSDKPVKFYNLDVIISVGYRVKSHQGTKFRQWATARLREYIVKGFTMNDELLKQAGGGNYFDELLARIRDIRSSEKVFWRKVLDIYATSIDYDPKTEVSQHFFKTVQNKMHFAAHGNTAAEVIYKRIDADKPNLGLTNFKGEQPSKQEIQVAKNYLTEDELNILNRTVTAYLELAELQALNRKPMYMQDWIMRLDDFLHMVGNEVLQHAGAISHDQAVKKAELEYAKYKEKTKNELSKVEKDFVAFIDTTSKSLESKKKK
ncbi:MULTISPECIES: virulence RhuM family protein [Sphingobacterium]|uniref:Cell filamentation protein Fic n=1 Tax=Sphingobacterium multivorum TaxID=28454 RepID=A0A654CQ44_SPHMU|nr:MULTISPECIES: virulence RhuM family protein [Sphingobacterium]HBI86987.1 cell filamentation protein Fic [Sphingobacterium sp.]OJZ15177.1 MAG: cell filamentation protein Fic [Sphingobacterium sp. 40-24]QQT44616.1 virulence RhuM family protein [Sphingobacterium multivorum]SUJ87874.1 Virulence protein [Sphingobacterium multivorum]VXC94876.1 Cell filamentation protein Fic [Sphingobacterium multivorum]